MQRLMGNSFCKVVSKNLDLGWPIQNYYEQPSCYLSLVSCLFVFFLIYKHRY